MSRKIILPDEVINEILQLSTEHSENSWRLGDCVIKHMHTLYPTYSKTEIRKALADASKLNIETIRDRERMSRRIPPCDREYEPLLYSQYRACLSAGSDWKKYAEWAVSSMDDYGGNPPPVSVIRMQIKKDGGLEPTWKDKLERIVEILETYAENPNHPAYVCDGVREATAILHQLY